MLKIRLQGTTNDLKWFKKILERDTRIHLIQISEPLVNKGIEQKGGHWHNANLSCTLRRRKKSY
jgi:hypothetical protein